jgi:protein RecA
MAKREKLIAPKNNYFTSLHKNLSYISTGCTIMNCILGGGYVLGRIVNIVGDKSTAKTALACEAVTNFISTYPKGRAAYRETEAAFDLEYAAAMGMPIAKVDFGDPDKPVTTVEDFQRDLLRFVDQRKDQPGIYVLDSLDALSDEAEMERDISEGSYGTSKAKQLSAMFRKLARKIERSKVLLIVVSQVRDNIGVAFGEKHRRSGGHSLDFYASQIMWLAHLKTLKKTIKGVERPIGVVIKAAIKKNKVALNGRYCEFPFIFGYGVEDIMAGVDYLKDVNRLDAIKLKPDKLAEYKRELEKLSDDEYRSEQREVADAVTRTYWQVEDSFIPKRSKYGP